MEGGYTPLLMAAQEGRADVAHILVEAGADMEATDSNGYTL
jgi:ankyrin repeat protein